MRKITVSRGMLTLFLVATLLVSITEAGSWSSPSYVTEPNFCSVLIGFPGLSISGDGSKIAFETFVNNASDIFVINSDGSGLKQLTNDSKGDEPANGQPSISGDGNKIAFQKTIYCSDSDEHLACEIFVVNSDGSGLKQLTKNSGDAYAVLSQEPSISGDGSKIAFKRVDFNTWDRGIFVINSDGTGETQLTNSTYFDQKPSISYDGNKVAFLGGDDFDFQIFVINSDGTGLKQLTNNTGKYQPTGINPFCGPHISGDGSKVAFEGYVGKDMEIFVVNSDGTGLRQLTDNTEDDWAPSISGDGSRIAFQRCPFYDNPGPEIKHQIFVINSDGTGLTQLTDDSERSFMFPSISDNGEKIAFWRAFSSHPESEVDFKYEVGISLVNYLSDVEDENGADAHARTPLVIAFAAGIGVLGFTYFLYHRRHRTNGTFDRKYACPPVTTL